MDAVVQTLGDKLKVDADLSSKGRKSSTGKSDIFFTTGGFIPTGNGYMTNVTVIKKNGKS